MSPLLYQAELRRRENKEGVAADRLTPSLRWWRGRDLNPRPLGYEPNELPDCSTPRCRTKCIRALTGCQTCAGRDWLAREPVFLTARVGSEVVLRNQRIWFGGDRNDPVDEVSGTNQTFAPGQRFKRKRVVLESLFADRQLRVFTTQLRDPLLRSPLLEIQQPEVMGSMIPHEKRVPDERRNSDQECAFLASTLTPIGERPAHETTP